MSWFNFGKTRSEIEAMEEEYRRKRGNVKMIKDPDKDALIEKLYNVDENEEIANTDEQGKREQGTDVDYDESRELY